MGSSEHAVWIDVAPEVLWRVYADPSRIPEWQTGSPVISELHGSPGEPGSSYVSRRSPGSAITSVVSADPPHRLVTSTDAYRGLRFDVTSLLEPERGGTRLTLRVATQWPRGMGLIGKVVELAILSGREARKELGRLKALVERDADGRAADR